jgi:hypothetical protein
MSAPWPSPGHHPTRPAGGGVQFVWAWRGNTASASSARAASRLERRFPTGGWGGVAGQAGWKPALRSARGPPARFGLSHGSNAPAALDLAACSSAPNGQDVRAPAAVSRLERRLATDFRDGVSGQAGWKPALPAEAAGRFPRSAEWHSAVAQIGNLLGVAEALVSPSSGGLPNAIRRYGRLQTCATAAAGGGGGSFKLRSELERSFGVFMVKECVECIRET